MAKLRIGFSTAFELENELVGIGTDNPTNTLQALGNIKSTDAKVVGVSTFTTFDGFTDTKLRLEGSAGTKQHTTSGEIIIEGEVTVSSGTTYTSGPKNLTVTNKFTLPKKTTYAPTVGSTRFNENLAALEFYTGTEWRAVNSYVDSGNRGRGILAGGFAGKTTPSASEVIDYITIATLGNSQDFGNLTEARARCSAAASSIRACIQMGQYTNKIDYITIQSTGNSIDFGDASSLSAGYRGSAASSTRGIFAGGYTPAPTNNINNIDYITIATLGDGIDFGDLTGPRWTTGGLSSPVRAIFGGGYEGPNSGPFIDGHPSINMDYVTISTKGNAVQFGKLTDKGDYRVGLSNNIRGIYAGGGNPANKLNNIEYITIASTGNTQYFGDLMISRQSAGACSTQTRGTFSGGRTPSFVQIIDYITIASAGSAVNFGQLTDSRFNTAGCSDAHGGLGGF